MGIIQKSLEIASKFDRAKEKYENQLLFSSFSFLCYFLMGDYEKGIHIIKKAKKQIDSAYFKEHQFTGLIKNFLMIIKNQNMTYINKIENELSDYDFLEGEIKLVKNALAIAKISLSLKSELNQMGGQY